MNGHVLGSLIQTMLAVAVVLAVALLVGFRPTAGPIEWLSVIGLLAPVDLALTWLSVHLVLLPRPWKGASNLPLPLLLLPFLGSGFVPTEGMHAGLRWFGEYQPFTPIMDTLRGLPLGTAIGSSGIIAIASCAAITAVGYLWARRPYNRDPVR